ncbi:MAG: galactose/methyl galactoside ABC transporter permease MglC [Lachnospiraceae bacterium]|nr:galactose/methyl galactoside ABC transporter permease MglC [Lachnospiraceae bacterium]
MEKTNQKIQADKIKEFVLNHAIYLVLIALLVIIVILEPRFLSLLNLQNILAQSSTKILIALGAGMILVVQGVDLSAGRAVGLACVISASLMQSVDYAYRMYPNLPDLPLIVPFAVAIVVLGIVGLAVGAVVAYLHVPPFIATLGVQLLLYGATSVYYSSQPSGPQPYGGIKSSITTLSTGGVYIGAFRLPYLVIIAAAAAVIMWVIWNKTRFGKYMFAVGGNPETARVSGINVKTTLLKVYCTAFVLYAIAAVLEVGRIGSASNGTGDGYEMDAVAACVVGGVSLAGGVGSVGGIVVGVLMFTVINYGMSFVGINMYWQYIVKGAIILLAVVLDMRKFATKK